VPAIDGQLAVVGPFDDPDVFAAALG